MSKARPGRGEGSVASARPGVEAGLRLAVVLALVLVVELGLFVAYGRFNIDEGMHLNAGRLVFEHGRWPYRDFPFSQAAAGPLVYGAVSAVFGSGLLAGRVFSAALSLVAVTAMAWFANRIAGRAAAAVVLGLVVANLPALWAFTQIRTEAASISLATLATIAWWFRRNGRSPREQIARWALAPCLLVLATAFRLTYAVPLLAVCGLAAWELRREPRALAWTLASVGLCGSIAALPMLAFWDQSFFHIVEAQWTRAARLGWAAVPASARIWYFGQPETTFAAVGVLGALPLWLLFRARRESAPAAAEPARAVAWLLAMAALTYLPTLVFKVGFFQYFVNASLLASVAIGISLATLAKLSARHRLALSGLFAVTWLATLALALVHVETWVDPQRPVVGRLAALRDRIQQLTPDGCTMLTFETHLAVETGCGVTPGLEYSYFSFFPDMTVAQARRHGVLNRRLLLRGLRRQPPEYVALTRPGIERVIGPLDPDAPPSFESMRGRYRLLETLDLPVGPIHTFWTEVFLYARADLTE